MTRLSTSPAGYDLIKVFEGFRADAAPLPGGGWVIGYGHTVSARAGAQVSRADALDLLKWDIARLERPICDQVFAPLGQNQFDALVSLVFNIGLDHFARSSVLRRLNEGCPVDAAAGFDAWRCARLNDVVIVVDALVRRRAAEKALFLATQGIRVIAPTPQLPPLCDKQLIAQHAPETPIEVKVDMHGDGTVHVASDAVSSADEVPAHSFTASENEVPVFVSLDEAFEVEAAAELPASPEAEAKNVGPVAAIAEKIVNNLDRVAAGPPADPVSESEPESNNEPEDHEAVAAPPFMDEDAFLLEPYAGHDEAQTGPDDQDGAVVPLGDGEDEPLPDLQTDAPFALDNEPFQPDQDRGRSVFILMGILGIALTFGGLWQIQRTGSNVITPFEMATGPGSIMLGLLMVVVSGYFLFRRLRS